MQFKVPGENEFKKMKEDFLNNPLTFNEYSNNSSEIVNKKLINDIEDYFSNLRNAQISLFSNRKAIENGLLREFSRVLFNEEKRIEVSLINDIEYNKALEILNNKKKYRDIITN